MQTELYKNIALRTGGDVYVGVVGPVRSGKSTFVSKFMQKLVIPHIENKFKRQRALDELPQSGNGKTITTIEPKFVPSNAASITLGESVHMNVRLVDSVGYMIPGVNGTTENGEKRKLKTPWAEEAMEIDSAAELGTRKVIEEHSTIAILMTTDGSIGELPRENYVAAEEKTVSQLAALGKPFIVLVNSLHPADEATVTLTNELKQKYNVGVVAKDVAKMEEQDFAQLIDELLWEFPIVDVDFSVPGWIMALDDEHWLKEKILDLAFAFWARGDKLTKTKKITQCVFEEGIRIFNDGIDLAKGKAKLRIDVASSLLLQILSEPVGVNIQSENDLFRVVTQLSETKHAYDKIAQALTLAKSSGYGMVVPSFDEFELEEPTQTTQGAHHGVRLSAKAQCLHIISTPLLATINPVIGEKEQCAAFFEELKAAYAGEKEKLWEIEIFSRSIKDLLSENMNTKLMMISPNNKEKLRRAVEKVSNAKKGSIIILFT